MWDTCCFYKKNAVILHFSVWLTLNHFSSSWVRCDLRFHAERWPALTFSASMLPSTYRWMRKNLPGYVLSVTRRLHMEVSSLMGWFTFFKKANLPPYQQSSINDKSTGLEMNTGLHATRAHMSWLAGDSATPTWHFNRLSFIFGPMSLAKKNKGYDSRHMGRFLFKLCRITGVMIVTEHRDQLHAR